MFFFPLKEMVKVSIFDLPSWFYEEILNASSSASPVWFETGVSDENRLLTARTRPAEGGTERSVKTDGYGEIKDKKDLKREAKAEVCRQVSDFDLERWFRASRARARAAA